MSMQSKQYNFSHHPIIDLQSVPKQLLWNPEIANFCKYLKTPEKDQTHRKERLPP